MKNQHAPRQTLEQYSNTKREQTKAYYRPRGSRHAPAKTQLPQCTVEKLGQRTIIHQRSLCHSLTSISYVLLLVNEYTHQAIGLHNIKVPDNQKKTYNRTHY